MLLGDVRRYLRPEILAAADVITPSLGNPHRTARTVGMFMLYRNVPRVNRLWRASKTAAYVLNSTQYTVFVRCQRRSRKMT